MATFEDFQKIDIRVGKIVEAENFPEAQKPSYKLKIDLGEEIGIKKSCAQLPQNYKIDDLIGNTSNVCSKFSTKTNRASSIRGFNVGCA